MASPKRPKTTSHRVKPGGRVSSASSTSKGGAKPKAAASKSKTASASKAGGSKAKKPAVSKPRKTASGSVKKPATSKKPPASTKAAPRKVPAKKAAPSKASHRASSRRAKPEELEPLDFEGTAFADLLAAAPASKREKTARPSELGLVDDEEDLDDEDYEEEEDFEEEDEDEDGRDEAGALGAKRSAAYSSLRGTSRVITSPPALGSTQTESPAQSAAASATPPSPPLPIAPWGSLDGVEDDTPPKSLDELLVGVFGLLLAVIVSVLNWYAPTNGLKELTGLSAGGFAVIPFVAGVGALLIVVLRRVGMKIRFPVDQGLMLEVIGYAAVGGTIAARFFRPKGAALVGQWGSSTLLAVAAGIGIAWFASRMSQGAPLVVRPGWFSDKAGRLGAAVLVLLLLLGGGLAILKPGSSSPDVGFDGLKYSKEAPACLTDLDFPLPDALVVSDKGFYRYDLPVTPGIDGDLCGAEFTSSLSLKKVHNKMVKLFGKAGWKFSITSGPDKGRTFIQFTKPSCGQFEMFDQGKTPGTKAITRGSFQVVPCTNFDQTPRQ